MSKNISLNVQRLKKQQQKTQSEDILNVMKDIGTLYEERKIPQFQTAENIYSKLLNAKTEKQRNSAFKQSDKIIEKHETKEPLRVKDYQKQNPLTK